MNLKRVVVSEDIMYTKTYGHQLLVNNLHAEEKTAVHATDAVAVVKGEEIVAWLRGWPRFTQ